MTYVVFSKYFNFTNDNVKSDSHALQHKKNLWELNERVREIIWSNRRLTIWEILEDLNMSYGSLKALSWSEWAVHFFRVFWQPDKRLRDRATPDSCFFWEILSMEVKLVSMGIILKPRFRGINGKLPFLFVWRNRVNQSVTSKVDHVLIFIEILLWMQNIIKD